MVIFDLKQKTTLLDFGLKNPIGVKNKMGKKIKAEKTITIEDGKHTGVISDIKFRDEPYEYTDILVKIDNTDGIEIKLGVPTKITENTALGKILVTFGVKKIEVDKEYDVEELLKGKKVEFMTLTKGKFVNIVEDSLKPL